MVDEVDEDTELDELLDEDADEWEDEEALAHILERMPNGWYMIKVENFRSSTFEDMDEWLSDECKSNYKRVGWNSGCSYMVGVQFEDSVDAVHFRLRWTG